MPQQIHDADHYLRMDIMKYSGIIYLSGKVLALSASAMLICFCFGDSARANHTEMQQDAVSTTHRGDAEAMKSRGPDASLTILPVRLAGQPFDRLTEVVGLLLEQRGLKNIELGRSVLNPESGISLKALADMTGEFIKSNPIATDYALYAEFDGNRQTGLQEIRSVMVDKAGVVVWTDRLTSEDEAFKKLESPEPLSLSMLLTARVGVQLGLNEDTAKAAKPGRMARLMEERSGVPPQEDTLPLQERQKELKKVASSSTLLIFPARVSGKVAEVQSASELVDKINEAGLLKASPAKQAVALKSPQADPNEMKVLWDFAREARDYARKNPFEADYVLFVDCVFNPQNWQQGYVHFVICDRNGEWVVADMQNSHHPDYQSVKPISEADCYKIVVERLMQYIR